MSQMWDYISPKYQCSYCCERFFSIDAAKEHVSKHFVRRFIRKIGDYVWGRVF